MSHVTDGLLHAWLDGALSPEQQDDWAEAEAHLEGCEACRQRLEEERGIRDMASRLLAASAVSPGDRPPFAEIAAAARRPTSGSSRGGWWRSTSRLAWAASLVMAAGAGWIGRELLIQEGTDVPGLVSEQAVSSEPVELRDEVDADLMAKTETEEPPAEALQQGAPVDRRVDQLRARASLEVVGDEESQETGILEVAREIMAAAHFAALVTLDETGQPRVRTMDPFPPEGDMTIWMATNPASRKVEQIRGDPRVAVYYFDPAGLGYVSLMGEARIVDDPAEKERRWKPEWERFYPDRQSSYILIEVRPNRLEVVSERHGLTGDPATWTPDGLSLGSP